MKHDLIIREPDLYFDSIHQELNNFLRDTLLTHSFANPLNIKKNSIWRPAIEVKQNKENYIVKVHLNFYLNSLNINNKYVLNIIQFFHLFNVHLINMILLISQYMYLMLYYLFDLNIVIIINIINNN